jgi:DNA-binding CsgD family transcriptional regulator
MPWHLVVLNTLSFFSIVIVYMALLDITHTVPAFPGFFGITGMNVWYMAATAAGILCFGYSWQGLPASLRRRWLGCALAGNGLGLAALAVGSASPDGNLGFLYAGTLLFPCTAGYIAGYLYYLISRCITSARHGTCIGIFLAATNLLLFVLDKLTRLTGSPLFLPWSFLLAVLAVMAFLLLQCNFSAAKATAEEPETPNPFVSQHMPLLLAMAVLLSLLVGFSDTLNFIRHEEYYANWHAFSRLFIVVGSLLAGWLADVHPAYLPLAALASKAVVMLFYALALEGEPFALMVCADVFFTSFTILFLTWMFLQVAIRSRRPAFWAGMGRAIEMPVSAIGTLLGISLLRHTSSNTITMVAYAALLVATGALFYYALLQLNRSLVTGHSLSLAAVPKVGNGFFVPVPDEAAAASDEAEAVVKNNEAASAHTTPLHSSPAQTETAVAIKTDSAKTDEAKTEEIKPEPERLQEQFGLTKRETEVLLALLNNETVDEISERLVITPRTTRFHITNILKKTGARFVRELPYIVKAKK